MNSKNIISFSLYNSLPLYNEGAIENIYEAQEFFPKWRCKFYVDETSYILTKLIELAKKNICDVIVRPKPKGVEAMLWRLETISDPNINYIIIRDTDQRISDKDRAITEDWIKRGNIAYRIKETDGHDRLDLLGGGFGVKGGLGFKVLESIQNWLYKYRTCEIGERKYGDIPKIRYFGLDKAKLFYGADQLYISECLWPLIKHDCITYGYNAEPFPISKPLKWNGGMFERIIPGTNCTKTFGYRPVEAYEQESQQ